MSPERNIGTMKLSEIPISCGMQQSSTGKWFWDLHSTDDRIDVSIMSKSHDTEAECRGEVEGFLRDNGMKQMGLNI